MQGTEAADVERGQIVEDHLAAALIPRRVPHAERPVRRSLPSQIR